MNPVSEDIQDILDSISSLGLELGTDLFIGRVPPKPNDCVTVLDVMGYPPQLTLQQGEDYEYPAFQVRVRNTDYLNGYTLANNIKTELHGRAGETWNGTFYSLIKCVGGPALLSWDEANRATFLINFDVQRR